MASELSAKKCKMAFEHLEEAIIAWQKEFVDSDKDSKVLLGDAFTLFQGLRVLIRGKD